MLCRLCLKTSVKVQDIFNSELKCAEFTLIESLYWIFGVEVDINDTYSKNICIHCEKVVQYVGLYRTLYKKNQLILEGKVNPQYEDGDEAQVMECQENAAICAINESNFSPTVKTRKEEFIKYYYEFSTSALQELIKGKDLKTNKQEIKKYPIEELFHVNEITVQVCKYCSQIFKYKKLLVHHYNTMHRVVSDKLFKQNKSAKKFPTGKPFIRKKNSFQKDSYTSNNDDSLFNNRSAKTFLFDTTNFPNLNFVKELDKSARDLMSKKANTLDTYSKKVNLAEEISESAMQKEDKVSDHKTLNSDEFQEIRTIKINKEHLSNEQETRETINDQYKWLNLKDFSISVKKLVMPAELIDNQKINSNTIPTNKDIKLNEFRVIKEKLDALNEKLKTRITSTTHEYPKMNNVNDNLGFDNVSKNYSEPSERYKHLNLKPFYISVQRCAVPHETRKETIEPQENNIDKSGKVKEWKEQVSSAIFKTQQIEKFKLMMLKKTENCTKTSAYFTDKQDTKQEVAPYLKVQKGQNRRNGHLDSPRTIAIQTNESDVQATDKFRNLEIQTVHLGHKGVNFAKHLGLKDFCIAIERCRVPEQFYKNITDQNYKESSLEPDNNPEGRQTSLNLQFNNKDDVTKTNTHCNSRIDSVTRVKHSYGLTDNLQTKFNQRSKSQRKEYFRRTHNTPKYRKRSITNPELHTSKSSESVQSDHVQNIKTAEVNIPRIDPLLTKLGYNVSDLKYQQEVNNKNVTEEMGFTSSCMPELKLEVDKMHPQNVINADEPPLLEREVEEVPRLNTVDEAIRSPTEHEYSIEVIGNKRKLECSSTKIHKRKLCKSRKKIQQRKTSSDESMHGSMEIEQLSDSLNLIKINSDKLHNKEINECEKTKTLEGKSIEENKTNKTKNNMATNILEISNHQNSANLQNNIKSRWSDITQGKISIVSELSS